MPTVKNHLGQIGSRYILANDMQDTQLPKGAGQ